MLITSAPYTVEEVQAFVRQTPRLLARGGGSKPALSTPPDGVERLDMSGIAGMLEYQPSEFTFTALAGTRLADINQALAEQGQYLPFDPLLSEHGATLGGTVASGVSGPGRYHYGGLRDFILGVRYINSDGELVRAGGKVVKNAAGFDLPKLMVGSRGGLGVLVELSFKVFPRPQAYGTLRRECASLEDALQVMQRAAAARLDMDSLDLEPVLDENDSVSSYVIWMRLGGLAAALPARLDRLTEAVGAGRTLQEADEEQIWRLVRELAWTPPDWSLLKVPLTPGRISALETALTGMKVLRRYSSGGQVAWLAFPQAPRHFEDLLLANNLVGLALFGAQGRPQLGEMPGKSFLQRVKKALDPAYRFVEA